MASYLSFLTSNNSTGSLPNQTSNISGLTSTWSNTFSSGIASVRKALTKDAEEDDPDNEDCSHVSNVLRAYYVEKGRSLPQWLPSDPKKPAAAAISPQGQYGAYGNNYGNQYGNQTMPGRAGSAGTGGLSDLWDSTPDQGRPSAQSLRALRPSPQLSRSHEQVLAKPGDSYVGSQNPQGSSTARPLPSQRAGSYQNAPNANPGAGIADSAIVGGGGGALGPRDRLRARLQGGGSGRSSPLGGPPTTSGQGSYGSSGNDNPSRSNSNSSGTPYMAASEPWSSGGNQYGYDANRGPSATQYGNQGYRQRPGGPR